MTMNAIKKTRLTAVTFQSHRKLSLPAEVNRLVCTFFCDRTMRQSIMRCYYNLILSQGPRPYRFEPIREQWRVTPEVKHEPFDMILDFLA